ncbi:NADH-cytochrome b5 reductase 1 [Pterulicium gracile]|uniref:NADH-cytochrome b5 reductase n=1 Tax=Pterulicium gracile TaxID=1884261 RepID=A0A5C3R661_9AGAR|nr:NADH-cytochrome b5 reductase 1 [Pterula gracilis]
MPSTTSAPVASAFPTQIVAAAVAVLTAFVLWRITSGSKQAKKETPVLNPHEYQDFPLVEKIVVSHNTAIYRFSLPKPTDVLGLPIGQHIAICAEINGKLISRNYTPTSSDDQRGYFDLLVKTYDQGNISKLLSLLKVGDTIKVKGPRGQFNYTPNLSRHLGMIAGGTGLTPMLQIIHAIFKNPEDKTKVSLIYANVTHDDILLKHELDELSAKHSDRFTVQYVLNTPPEGWTGGVGFVSQAQIAEHMPPSSADIKVLMCGPPPMMNAMKKHLEVLNYPAPNTISRLADQVFLF